MVISAENILVVLLRKSFTSVATEIDPVVKYTFAIYRDPEWRDWKSVDDVGVDAAAYVVTGYMADAPNQQGKDFIRQKQISYLFVHCNRTENGFFEDINGDLYPSNPSSCLVQARWEWSDSANSNRWGREFQAIDIRDCISHPVLLTHLILASLQS